MSHDLIIMDEPFTGLDPVNAGLLMEVLLEQRARGRTVLFSTHRMDQVEKHCDSIALIYRGRLLLNGTLNDIKKDNPARRLLVRFSGNSSFLELDCIIAKKEYAGSTELIVNGDDAVQRIIEHAVKSNTRLTHLELVEPTLEDIFIETVRGSAGE